jgi:hypothetical protein
MVPLFAKNRSDRNDTKRSGNNQHNPASALIFVHKNDQEDHDQENSQEHNNIIFTGVSPLSFNASNFFSVNVLLFDFPDLDVPEEDEQTNAGRK